MENTKELNLTELNQEELDMINGGGWMDVLAIASAIAAEWDDMKRGFLDTIHQN